jgi:Na+-driven multidrug efflux pump
VLIGAGDGPWLAKAMVAMLALYLPFVLLVHLRGDLLLAAGGAPEAVAGLWVAFTVFMAIRAGFFWRRVRGDAWAVTGAAR